MFVVFVHSILFLSIVIIDCFVIFVSEVVKRISCCLKKSQTKLLELRIVRKSVDFLSILYVGYQYQSQCTLFTSLSFTRPLSVGRSLNSIYLLFMQVPTTTTKTQWKNVAPDNELRKLCIDQFNLVRSNNY